jgi:acyl carrier protein
MAEQTEAALTKIFHDVFDDDSIVLRPDLTAADVEGWDSLAHVRLLLTVERKMGIKFNAVEAGKLKNVGELIALIDSKLSAPARK